MLNILMFNIPRPSLAIQQLLHLHFLAQMCTQCDEKGSFWKEDTKKAFLALKCMHLDEGEACCLLQNQCSSYHECRHALRILFKYKLVSLRSDFV